MSLFVMARRGIESLGSLSFGVIASHVGTPRTLLIGGAVWLLAVAAFATKLSSVRQQAAFLMRVRRVRKRDVFYSHPPRYPRLGAKILRVFVYRLNGCHAKQQDGWCVEESHERLLNHSPNSKLASMNNLREERSRYKITHSHRNQTFIAIVSKNRDTYAWTWHGHIDFADGQRFEFSSQRNFATSTEAEDYMRRFACDRIDNQLSR